jgi:hypothetical protein
MRLKPDDIVSFGYCPYLYWRRGTARVVPPLSTFEETVRKSILVAEAKALKNNTFVTPRSLGNIFDHFWWPAAAEAKIAFAEAEKMSLKASLKFTDYCKYDVSSSLYATIGTNVPFEVRLPHGVLAGNVDMIKLPIEGADKSIALIDMSRKGISNTQAMCDLAILSTVYAFQELKRSITYMCIDLSENLEKLKIISSSFDRDGIKETERAIQYLSEGIYRGVNYKSGWMCGECTRCGSR